MKRPFGRRSKDKENIEEKVKKKPDSTIPKERSLVDSDYNRKKLFKKGINLMADEKLEEAVIVFEQALRIYPDNVETLMKMITVQLCKYMTKF